MQKASFLPQQLKFFATNMPNSSLKAQSTHKLFYFFYDDLNICCQSIKLGEAIIWCQLPANQVSVGPAKYNQLKPALMSKYRNVLNKQQSAQLRQPTHQNCTVHITQQPNHSKKTTLNSIQPKNDIKRTKSQKPRLSLSRVSLVFSRIHHTFNLKFQTFSLAIELYSKCCQEKENPEQVSLPSGYLMLVCMYLSMKYEQIYYTRLKNIVSLIQVKLNLEEYMRYEAMVFKKLGQNLNIVTAKTRLGQLLKKSSNQAYFFAYYMLEIAYQDQLILSEFSIQVICTSIFYSMLPLANIKKGLKQFKGIPIADIIQCSKLLIQKKSKHTEAESIIFKKYIQEKYMKVALKAYFQISQSEIE